MISMKKYLEYIYLLGIFLSPITPILNSADVVAPQFISLTFFTIIGLGTLLINNSKKIKFKLFSLPLYCFGIYLTVASFSSFFAINKVESIIAITKIFIVFVNIYIIYSLELFKKIQLSSLLLISTFYLLVESLRSIYPITPILDFSGVFDFTFANEYMKGFTGNKNITSASIALKIPLALLLLHITKKRPIQILSIFTITISFITILFLGARATFLSLIIIALLSTSLHLFYLLKQNKRIFNSKNLIILFSLILGFFFFNSNIPENSQSSIDNRMNFIAQEKLDNSSQTRLRYYRQAINYFIQNPFIGAGIGNWKLVSIDLDKENVVSYIVPYNLHNDFLEILGETGIFGFLSYIGFFFSLIYILLRSLNLNNSVEHNRIIILLF